MNAILKNGFNNKSEKEYVFYIASFMLKSKLFSILHHNAHRYSTKTKVRTPKVRRSNIQERRKNMV